MKVRWREHEFIGVTILVAWQLIAVLLKVNDQSAELLAEQAAVPFKESGMNFDFWKNYLVPQVSSLVLLFGVYVLISRWVLPSFKEISADDLEKLRSGRIAKVVISILAVAYLLAIGINVISFYGRPDFFNYGGYQFLSLAGYNGQPLTDLFFGFGRTLMATMVMTGVLGLRDLIVMLIERPGPHKEYRVLITNNATALLIIFCIPVAVVDPDLINYAQYGALIIPLLPLYLYLMFWLFPHHGKGAFLEKSFSFRLLLATFFASMPGMLLHQSGSYPLAVLLYWMFLLFVATPLTWLVYQQRKDKILQLISMETALARSDASLQSLRAQINPHFLFNALNTLYGTALTGDTDKTAEGIQKLGDMMRFMLNENTQDQIPLDREIEYLKNFISLQKLRIQSSSDISIEDALDDASGDYQIAPMILIPFVENAFKHGISLKKKSWIRIELKCQGSQLQFDVRNSVHDHVEMMPGEKSGIGLQNVRDRLKLQYPDKHVLNIERTGAEFIVKLTITC